MELIPGALTRKQRPIPMHGETLTAMNQALGELLRDQKIESGMSAWSSPMFVVAKKVEKGRLVVDFRASNEVTVQDAHPLPRIEGILVEQGEKASVLNPGTERCFPPSTPPSRILALHVHQHPHWDQTVEAGGDGLAKRGLHFSESGGLLP